MASKNTLSALEGLRDLSVAPGAVFIGPWPGIDHEKYLIVAGVADDRILVCSVMINSEINPYIQCRPRMLSCQVLLKAADYDFLSHDSYANCAHLLNEQAERNAYLAHLQSQLSANGNPTTDAEAYIALALFVATHDPNCREVVKCYLRSHNGQPEMLRRMFGRVKRMRCR